MEDLSQREVIPNSIVLGQRLGRLRPELLKQISVTPGVILFHVSDEWYLDSLEPYRNFVQVVRNYYRPGLRRPGICQIPLGPSCFTNDEQEVKPVEERRYVWSFAGNLASTRRALVEGLRGVVPNFIHITRAGGQPRLGTEEYLKLLGDSVFVPCGMGNVNLESFRLYEALDCGAIPIVERRPWLDYFTGLWGPHPLPAVNDWGEARSIMDSLRADPQRLREKQREVQGWWREIEGQVASQISAIIEAAAGRQERVDLGARLPSRWGGVGEMLKHHNGTAWVARGRLTFRRLLGRG